MVPFENIQLTNNGLNLQAKAQIGKSLKFKYIKIGDGKIGSTPISLINDLKSYKLTIELNKFKVLTDGQAVVGGVLNNVGVSEGFYWRELGLYAEDPDTGLDVLYLYGNCGDLAEFIPAESSNSIIERIVNLVIITSNMSKVSAAINQSLVFVDKEEFEKRMADMKEIIVSETLPEKENCIWFKVLNSTAAQTDEIYIETKAYNENEKYHLETVSLNNIEIETITNMTDAGSEDTNKIMVQDNLSE